MSSSLSGESHKDRSKKKYSKFTQEELEQINRLFAENGFYPDVNEVREFAKTSGIKVIKLENWFKYNRRKMAYHGNLMTYRKRRVFRHQDLDYLRNFFEEKPYPKSSQYKEIAKKINAPLQQVINWFANQRKKYSKSKGSCSKHENGNDSFYNNDETNSSMIKLEEDYNNVASTSGATTVHCAQAQADDSNPVKKPHYAVKNKRISKMNPKFAKANNQNTNGFENCDNLKELTKENIKMLSSMDQNMLNWPKMAGFDATIAQRLALQSQLSAEMMARTSPMMNAYNTMGGAGNVKTNTTQQQDEIELRREAFLKMINMQKKLNYFNNFLNNKQMRDYYMMQLKFAEFREMQNRTNVNQMNFPFYYPNGGNFLANGQNPHQSNFWQAAQNYCNQASSAISALGNFANISTGSHPLSNTESLVNNTQTNKSTINCSLAETKLQPSENLTKNTAQVVAASVNTKLEDF